MYAWCADNAHADSSTSLSVRCTSSGTWSGPIPQCDCDNGYRKEEDIDRELCKGSYIHVHFRYPCIKLVLLIVAIVCEAKNVGLVHYPTTFGSNLADVNCVDHAHQVTPDFTAWCDASGNWSDKNIRCECDTDYRVFSRRNRQICEGKLNLPCIALPYRG